MAGNAHCIVVGAGMVGSCCAWYLSRGGARVTLIDSELPGQSASFGNAGCISPTQVFPFSFPGVIKQVPGWLFDPQGPLKIRGADLLRVTPWLLKFLRAGNARRVGEIIAAQFSLMSTVTEDFDQLLTETGGAHLRESRGVINLFDSETHLQKDSWKIEIRKRYGLPWQRLTREEFALMEPDVELGAGVAYYDSSWQHIVDPGGATDWIARAALGNGADWLQDRVIGVEAQPGQADVRTASGRRLQADALIIAGGAWSNTLTRQLGHRVPLMAKRGYHSMVAQPGVQLNHPIHSISRMFVMTPMRDGLRAAGIAEFAMADAEPDYRHARRLMDHLRHYCPGLNDTEVSEWMGPRPMMPDSLPVIGPLPGHANVFCAFGHGHYGLTQGPTTGRIIQRLVSGADPGIDLSPYAANRF